MDIALANGGSVLFADVAFGTSGGYIEVPGGDLRSRSSSRRHGYTVALSIPGVNVTGNRVFTVVATGLLSTSVQASAPSRSSTPKHVRTDVNGDGQDLESMIVLAVL